MRALVTGFEPFGGWSLNASQLVVTALAAREESGIVTAVLPTSYRRSEERIGCLLRAHRPDVLLMLGLAHGADRLRLERFAHNRDDSGSPDNDGEIRAGQMVVEGAPDRYPSSLLLGRMAESARAFGEEVSFSEDAGGYVCNHLFFAAAHLVATELPGCRCGFVHLPPMHPSEERLARISEMVRAWLVER